MSHLLPCVFLALEGTAGAGQRGVVLCGDPRLFAFFASRTDQRTNERTRQIQPFRYMASPAYYPYGWGGGGWVGGWVGG